MTSWAGGHFEREAQCGDVISRMIVGVGELRKTIELLASFRSLVNSRIEVDEVHARRTCGREVDDDVTAAVEAAGVAHVRVVVRGDVDVVVVRPADALQVNRHRRARRSRPGGHAHDARLDHEVGACQCLATGAERDGVETAEIVGDCQRRVELAVGPDVQCGQLGLSR